MHAMRKLSCQLLQIYVQLKLLQLMYNAGLLH